MSFITDNYIWFLIIGFVLLMIVIGYYAEKTKFGKRMLSEDDLTEATDKLIQPDAMVSINALAQNNAEAEILDVSNDQMPITNSNVDQNLSVGIGELAIENSKTQESVSAPVATNFSDDDVWKF